MAKIFYRLIQGIKELYKSMTYSPVEGVIKTVEEVIKYARVWNSQLEKLNTIMDVAIERARHKRHLDEIVGLDKPYFGKS